MYVIESTCGYWIGFERDGRWIGRQAKRVKGSYAYKANAKYDLLIPNITRIIGKVAS